MSAQYSPLPWTDDFGRIVAAYEPDRVAGDGKLGCMRVVAVVGPPGDGGIFADEGKTNEANAAFIIRAVNSHEALVDALELVMTRRRESSSASAWSLAFTPRQLQSLEAALKSAKGESPQSPGDITNSKDIHEG